MKKYLTLFLGVVVIALFFLLKGCGPTPIQIYSIARDPRWYPLNFAGKEKNVLALVDDLVIEIAHKEGFKVELLSWGSGSIESALQRNEFDAMLSSLPPTSRRQENYLFSDPCFYVGPVLIVAKDSTVASLADLKDKRIGLQTNSPVTIEIPLVTQHFDSNFIALESLLKGDIDAVIMDLISAYSYMTTSYEGKLKVAGPLLSNEGLRLVMNIRSKHTVLIGLFNSGLKALKASGRYEELLKKWALSNPQEQGKVEQPALTR